MTEQQASAARTFLLLGGTGFLGRNLARVLKSAGHRVLVGTRDPDGSQGGSVRRLPIGDTAAIMACVRQDGVDTVIHLVCGLLPSSDLTAYLGEIADVNLPTIALAAELARCGVALVFVSSGGTVYGKTSVPRVSEATPCTPINLYGEAKHELEQHLMFLARTAGLDLLVLRPSNPYGLYQPLRGTQGFVSVVLGRIMDGLPLEIWGDGSVVRDYVHVDDACGVMAGLIGRQLSGTFNIGSGVGHSLIDVVRFAEQVTGRSVEVRFRSARAADVPRLVLDVGRLRQLGLDAARPLMAGMQDYARELGMTDAA